MKRIQQMAISSQAVTPADISDTYIPALVFQGGTSESFARHGQTLWELQYVLLARGLL